MAKHSYWPPPVYVASFGDGTVCQMSIWSQEGKPLDFERGRKVCCGVIGYERAHRAVRDGPKVKACDVDWLFGEARVLLANSDIRWHPNNPALRYAIPAGDLIAGYFEHEGWQIADPYFEPGQSSVSPAPKPRKKASALDRVLAAIEKLSAEDLAEIKRRVVGEF